MTEDTYVKNYFRHNKSEEGSEEKVPIRWMALESIENDIYTDSTDVVSALFINRLIRLELSLLSYILGYNIEYNSMCSNCA